MKINNCKIQFLKRIRLFFISLLLPVLFTSNASADIISCKGNIGFWIRKSDSWRRVGLKSGEKFTAHHTELAAIMVGKYKKFPAITVFPFFGIQADIVNKDVRFESDNEKYFIISKNKNQILSCDISSEAGM